MIEKLIIINYTYIVNITKNLFIFNDLADWNVRIIHGNDDAKK